MQFLIKKKSERVSKSEIMGRHGERENRETENRETEKRKKTGKGERRERAWSREGLWPAVYLSSGIEGTGMNPSRWIGKKENAFPVIKKSGRECNPAKEAGLLLPREARRRESQVVLHHLRRHRSGSKAVRAPVT